MANTERGLASRAARKSTATIGWFLLRWLFWSALIAAPAWFVGEALWPPVYKKWGPPMGVFQDDAYWAVLFGDMVSAILGGAAVAFVGTFRRGR